jgi:hypothetical protein
LGRLRIACADVTETIPAALVASGMAPNDCASSSFGRREVSVTTDAADTVVCCAESMYGETSLEGWISTSSVLTTPQPPSAFTPRMAA